MLLVHRFHRPLRILELRKKTPEAHVICGGCRSTSERALKAALHPTQTIFALFFGPGCASLGTAFPVTPRRGSARSRPPAWPWCSSIGGRLRAVSRDSQPRALAMGPGPGRRREARG